MRLNAKLWARGEPIGVARDWRLQMRNLMQNHETGFRPLCQSPQNLGSSFFLLRWSRFVSVKISLGCADEFQYDAADTG